MPPKKPKTVTTIPDKLIREVGARLSEGKRVRRTLPMDGRLHIDRTLPFLVVYRRPHKQPDKGTDELVKGEASYLIAPAGPRHKPALSKLVHTAAAVLSGKFGAFMIIEIRSDSDDRHGNNTAQGIPNPLFRVHISTLRPPAKAAEALERSLKRMTILKRKVEVEEVKGKTFSPPGLPPLLTGAEILGLNCFMIGIEVQPVFRETAAGDIFPLLLRRLRRGLGRAIKKAVFEFAHEHTSYRPLNYQSLGRRAVVKAVWDIDTQMAAISNAFDFLLMVTPVNIDSAWAKFKRSRFQQAPVLYYRPLPVSPEFLKRRLYEIPIERMEDPTLEFLFREKRTELDRKITMMVDRGKPQFLYGGLQLYGAVSDELLVSAKDILTRVHPRSHDESTRYSLDSMEFAKRAEEEIDFYRQTYSDIPCKVKVLDDTVGLMVSRGNLYVSKQLRIPLSRVEALIQHEVGTHIVTYLNGRAQPFQQLYCGLAGYDELQEGLAVLAEYMVGGLSRPRLRLLAGRVLAAHYLVSGASFVETFRELNRTFGFDQRTAFTITVRVYRGGGLIKDAVYLRGLVGLLKYLGEGGDLEVLFVGKIAAEHISFIRELQYRKVLRPPILFPRYLNQPQIKDKLKRLENGLTPLDLIERRK